jgi:lycopene cyclase domain-containing protein
MSGLGYTVPAVAAAAAVCAWELAFLRTGLFRRPAYWLSMAIVLAFQIPVDGWLTKLSAPTVEYAPRQMTGLRLTPWDIPAEDFLFGVALVTSALLLWERQGRGSAGRERGDSQRAAPDAGDTRPAGARSGRDRPGPDQARDRPGPDRARWRRAWPRGRRCDEDRVRPAPLRPVPKAEWARQEPTFAQARPALIDAVVKRAGARPSGNWFVLAARRQIHGDRPYGVTVAATGVPVRAEFRCPEPRTVIMRIIEGEGEGSVVETHAAPLGRGPDGHPRTAVIEAVVACSGRRGFAVARAARPVLRPVMRRAAARLRRDDLAYAERRYRLRSV